MTTRATYDMCQSDGEYNNIRCRIRFRSLENNTAMVIGGREVIISRVYGVRRGAKCEPEPRHMILVTGLRRPGRVWFDRGYYHVKIIGRGRSRIPLKCG